MKLIQGFGGTMFLVGAAAMDSEQLIYPIMIMAAGALIVWMTCRFEMD